MVPRGIPPRQSVVIASTHLDVLVTPIVVGIDGQYTALVDADLLQATAEFEVAGSAHGQRQLRQRITQLELQKGRVRFPVRLDVAAEPAVRMEEWLSSAIRGVDSSSGS